MSAHHLLFDARPRLRGAEQVARSLLTVFGTTGNALPSPHKRLIATSILPRAALE